jgi:thioredoxin 1
MGKMKDLNTTNFNSEVLQADKPVVIEVFTQSCPHCKRLDTIFDFTAQVNSNKYCFYKMDAQKNMDLVKKHKVLTVPTLLFFSHGKLVNKKSGVISQEKIEQRLNPLLDYTQEIAQKKEITSFFKLPWSKHKNQLM